MGRLEMWALIVGFVMPLVIAVVQRSTWTQTVRALVMAVSSLIAGGLTAYFAGQLNGVDVTTSVLIVAIAAIASYVGFWRPTTVAPKIEAATSPKPRP
jgi:small basic protein